VKERSLAGENLPSACPVPVTSFVEEEITHMSTNTISQKTPTQAQRATGSAASAAVEVQPYVFFDGRCEEALEFYRTALGAKIEMLMRYKDSPEPAMCAPGSENKVMHANFRIGGSTILASDGRCEGKPNFQGFALSLTVPTAADADRLFARLADGGKPQMPLAKTFFSERFGMVTDRFGVLWMVYVRPAQDGA
jgi:PhnB protein